MKRMIKYATTWLMCSALFLGASLEVWGADLIIGRSNEPSALDPQFSRTGNNQMTAENIFQRLLSIDANLQMHPQLAVQWQNLDPLTWEISLRQNVTFHDGSPLSADDVIFSLNRTDKVPNSPAPFTDVVSTVEKVEKIDDHTIRVITKTPNPSLMEQIGRVFILSKKHAENATLEDFNSGKATIGTGPYRFIEWKPAQSLSLQAYDGYWDTKPDFNDVEIRFIPNDAARTAALLSGSVDLIDSVPPSDVAHLQRQDGLTVYATDSARLIYLALNMRDETAPGIVDETGKLIKPNPFRDVRVRKALSMMIDRRLMVDRILNGSGTPTAQIVPAALGGYVEDLTPLPPDLEAAKELLRQAGFDNGFGITLYSSNNRFPGDSDIAQAIGQMFARAGLNVRGIETQPYNVYAGAATKGEYGAFIFSLGAGTPNAESNLRALLQTYNADAGTGGFNRMRYSNAKFDAILQSAMTEFDYNKRMEKLQQATRIAMEDQAIIPLYFQKIYWAGKKELTFIPNMGEDTVAQDVGRAK